MQAPKYDYKRDYTALKLADRAVILDTGKVVYDGSAREVMENADLRHEYLAI